MNDKTEALLADLHAGVRNLTSSEEWQRYLDTAAKFHNYSANNQLLIHLQRPDATRVAGYRKWEEMDRQVRKGEHGIAILAPVLVRDHDDSCSKPKRGCRCPQKLVGYKTVYVFDVAQTDGEPLPEPVGVELLGGDAPAHLWAALEAQCEDAGRARLAEIDRLTAKVQADANSKLPPPDSDEYAINPVTGQRKGR